MDLTIQRAENRAKLAEDRANKNDILLNQKLLELSRVQETLTHQTKVRFQVLIIVIIIIVINSIN